MIEVKKIKNKIQNCTFTKEQHDMLNCNMTHDDDGNIEQIQLLNSTGFYYNHIKFK